MLSTRNTPALAGRPKAGHGVIERKRANRTGIKRGVDRGCTFAPSYTFSAAWVSCQFAQMEVPLVWFPRAALACCLAILAVPSSAAAAPAVVGSTTLPAGATAFSLTVDPGTGRVYAVDPVNHLVRVYDSALNGPTNCAVAP